MSGLGALTAFALPAPAAAQREDSATRARAVLRLRNFFVSTLGQSTEERLRLANAALSGVDPFDASSLLVEIAAMGVVVRGQPVQASVRAGYPSRSKSSIERATAAFPDAAWTMALTGAWHYEVVRRSTLGAMMLGASRQSGRQFFERAIASATSDPGVRVAYAISLLSDPQEDSASRTAATVLDVASATEAGDAPDAYLGVVRRHADELRGMLRTRSLAQVQAHVLDSY